MKNMRMTLLDIYWKTRKIIAPKLSYSQDIYEQVLKQYVNHGAIWLDLGCGHQILPARRSSALIMICPHCNGTKPSLSKSEAASHSYRSRTTASTSSLPTWLSSIWTTLPISSEKCTGSPSREVRLFSTRLMPWAILRCCGGWSRIGSILRWCPSLTGEGSKTFSRSTTRPTRERRLLRWPVRPGSKW